MRTKEISISGHPKNTVIAQLCKSFTDRNYELACYYSVQMHCSNWMTDWWNSIIVYAAKNMSITNPKIGKFLYTIQSEYPSLKGNVRGNPVSIQETIALVVGVLTFSPKGVLFHVPKAMEHNECIKVLNTMEMTNIHFFVEKISLPSDPKLVLKIMSKFVEAIQKKFFQESLRILSLCMFLEREKNFKNLIVCGPRNWKQLNEKQKKDWVFLLWDVILNISAQRKDLYEIISCWRTIYVDAYLSHRKTALLAIIVHSLILLTNPIDLSINVVNEENIIKKGCENIHFLYTDVAKRYERSQALLQQR
tara:strand:+ start:8747 stop:9664 length:918 start_codon:yes stop_codon:yes gene_type:complete